jgi:hypothetical protein
MNGAVFPGSGSVVLGKLLDPRRIERREHVLHALVFHVLVDPRSRQADRLVLLSPRRDDVVDPLFHFFARTVHAAAKVQVQIDDDVIGPRLLGIVEPFQ